jgi:hypothetical protein
MKLSPSVGCNGSTAIRMDRHLPLWQGVPVDSGHRSPVTVQVLDVLPGLCGRQRLWRRLILLLKPWLLRVLLKLWLGFTS